MSELSVSYTPPRGRPLGTNFSYWLFSVTLIPIIKIISKKNWKGLENIPTTGPVIFASNHLSYFDAFGLAYFLHENGRAPRFLGKASVFRIPVLGRALLAAGHVPIERESGSAHKAIDHARAILSAGHALGLYPEGTLTRDPDLWPMAAKTGIARLALQTGAPVIPIAQWGAQEIIPTYGKKLKLFPRTTLYYHCGKPVDLSEWAHQSDDQEALLAATAKIMREITVLLEEIRGQKRPQVIFDPRNSDLPRTGNFKKKKKGQ
jgi:1-acyl-sn-glycerol-3-phosphate acyltransferase